MKKLVNIFAIGFQIAIAFVSCFVIFFILALLDSDWGFDGIIALAFSTVWAVIFSVITIVLCLLIGLPLRINKTIANWWSKKHYLSLLGIFIGTSLLFLAFLPDLKSESTILLDGQETLKTYPNLTLIGFGWFLIPFSILHFNLSKIVFNILEKINGVKY